VSDGLLLRGPSTATSPAVRAMLEARTVAVVGASARPGSFGAQLVAEATSGDPAVRVIPVNPRYRQVHGLPCVPSLAEVDEPPDVVLLGVPNTALEAQLMAAAQARARSAVVYASGYEPPQPGRPPLVERLAAIASEADMAVCGGNCMGFWNLDHGVRALGFQERDVPPLGPVTFLSHSGSAFSALLRNNRRIGFNLAVSAGQEYVTTLADYAHYALDQPTTRVLAFLMETARDPAGLRSALVRAAEADVPVVALKVGRSERARALVTAHSGALAGEDAAYEAFFDAHGVVRVEDIDELCDTVELLCAGRRAGPGQLAAVHDSGAERALVVDVADQVRAPFAELSPATLERLTASLDPGLEPTNPLDVWGTGRQTHDLFAGALAILAEDRAVAAVALGVDLVHEYDGELDYLTAVISAAAGTTKPVVLLSNAHSAIDPVSAAHLREAGVPVLEGTRSGLLALRHLLELRDARARPAVPTPALDRARRQAWARRLDEGALSAADSLALLADYGVPVVPTRTATTVEEAVAAAAALGYPVALKTDQPAVAHKTEAGGVRLGIADETGLRTAYTDIADRLGAGVSVSAMAEPGVELALGLVRDAQLGPLVLVAAGGLLVEVLHDRALAVPPLDRDRARAVLDRLRVRPLLDGVRGGPAAALHPVLDAVVAVSTLAMELGDRIDELDVNPLLCGPRGVVAVDALVVAAGSP
jgi:acetate---CoA ligase (ADP-forming)